jgi:CBS domain-containing protein
MNVGKLCKRDIATIGPRDELSAAAELMRERHVGYLVVVEPDPADNSQRPVGVLTDRDIVVSVVARQIDPRTLRVGEVMTEKPVVAAESDSMDKALASMRRIGVRRLPIVGGRGQLVGVMSLDDVLDSIAGELGDLAGSIRNEQRIEGALRP